MSRTGDWWRQPTPHDLAMVALGLMVVVSLFISPQLSTSLPAALWLLLGMLGSAMVARWARTDARVQGLWAGACLVTGGLVVVGLWGLQNHDRPLFPQLGAVLRTVLAVRDRIITPLPDSIHPNVLAGALIIVLPFCLAAWLRPARAERVWRDRILSISATLVWLMGCALVALTQSRGAYLGLAAGLVLFALLWPRSLWVLGPAAIAGVAGFVLFGGSLGTLSIGLDWRTIVWRNGLRVLNSFPYTGVGLGCFRLVTNNLFPMSGLGSVDASHAHNLYLQVGIDLGVPGLVAYVALLGLSFYLLGRAYRASRLRGDLRLRLMSAAALAAFAGLCVHGLVDVGLWGSKPSVLPWILIGLSVALERQSVVPEHQSAALECHAAAPPAAEDASADQ